MAASRLLKELRQSKPFGTLEQEAVVALFRTVDHVRRLQTESFVKAEMTEQQFNVLRILRGAGNEGLPTLSVADRLIEQTPGITRLLDRLEAKGLVRRERPAADRRQVYCFITPAGLDLLKLMDPEVAKGARRAMQHLTQAEMKALLEILETIRDAK